ncbi:MULTISPECIES: HNH endonuclease [unclassified Nocardia]|uniref:HNH endonuclease n=1 Tax=unclassified Nocardia TaxID=2637762 RepID=UPI0033ACB8D5
MISRAESERRMALYEQGLKECSGCAEALPIDEFYPNSRGWMGLFSRCRACMNAATLERQRRNPEVVNSRNRRWTAANPCRRRRIGKEYRDTHPLEERLRGGRTRARNVGLPADDITAEALLADWERRGITPEACAYCGGEFEELEHMHPLSREGSPGHVLGNLAPSCKPCNARKSRRHWVEYLADRCD